MKHARDDYNRIQDPAGIIPEEEPVFLIRGKDACGPAAVLYWAALAEMREAQPEVVEAATRQARLMCLWQIEHGAKVPDMPVPA